MKTLFGEKGFGVEEVVCSVEAEGRSWWISGRRTGGGTAVCTRAARPLRMAGYRGNIMVVTTQVQKTSEMSNVITSSRNRWENDAVMSSSIHSMLHGLQSPTPAKDDYHSIRNRPYFRPISEAFISTDRRRYCRGQARWTRAMERGREDQKGVLRSDACLTRTRLRCMRTEGCPWLWKNTRVVCHLRKRVFGWRWPGDGGAKIDAERR